MGKFLSKVLNPFGIKVTSATKLYVWVGSLVSLFLHGAFYYALFHFISKFW